MSIFYIFRFTQKFTTILISDWFKILYRVHFDQLAVSSQGVKTCLGQRKDGSCIVSVTYEYEYFMYNLLIATEGAEKKQCLYPAVVLHLSQREGTAPDDI